MTSEREHVVDDMWANHRFDQNIDATHTYELRYGIRRLNRTELMLQEIQERQHLTNVLSVAAVIWAMIAVVLALAL